MTTCSCVGFSTMKPCCRILSSYKSSSLFGFSPTKFNDPIMGKSTSSIHNSHRHLSSNTHFVGYIRVSLINLNRRDSFSISNSKCGPSRIFSKSCLGSARHRCVSLLVTNVASDFRNHSTSVESHVSQIGFENIYIQGGLNVKPLVIERIETGHSALDMEQVSEETTKTKVPDVNSVDSLKGLNEGNKFDREVSEIEREAWMLLQDAVVTYCGNPLGTVAAKDPSDKQPLNYDQVFVRDFIPSALAFLLNGEGEIVKNFLLHTLQLQGWEKTVDCYSLGED